MTAPPTPPPVEGEGAGSDRDRALSGVRALMMRHIAIAAMSALGTTYLVRHFGPAAWGGFAVSYLLLVSVDSLVARAVLLGIIRDDRDPRPADLAAAARLVLYIGLGASVFLAVFPLLASPWYAPPDFWLIMVASAACALLYTARALSVTLLERGLRYGPIAASEVLDMTAFYAVAVVGVALGYGLPALALATIARGCASLIVCRRAQRAPLLGSGAGPAAKTLLPFGAPLAAVLAVGAGEGLIPVVTIGWNEAEVGFVLVSAQILGYGIAMVSAASRVGVPSLARLSGDRRASAIVRAVELATFLTLSAVIPLAALAGLWLPPLFGDAWSNGVETFQIVALGFLSAGPIGMWTSTLTASGHSTDILRAQTTVALFYLVAAFGIVALIGVKGCAVAYALSRLVNILVLRVAVRRRAGVGVGTTTVLLFAAGLAALGATIAAAAVAGWPAAITVLAVAAIGWLVAFRRLAALSISALMSGVNVRLRTS